MKKLAIISLAVLAFSLHSCRKDYLYVEPVVPAPANLSFAIDIFPILNASTCKNCHSGTTAPKITTDATVTHTALTTGTTYVNIASPATSVLYLSVSDPNFAPFQMPSGTKLSANDQAKILAWITQGAKP